MAQLDNFASILRYDASTNVNSVDPFNQVIWKDELPSDMPSSQYTFIFSGPPIASMAFNSIDLLSPIGLVQDIQYNAQRQLTPVAELGNRYYRHVGGRWSHTSTLNRILSREANIIGMFYRWAIAQGVRPVLMPGNDDSRASEIANVNLQAVAVESDLLNIPFGLYVVELTENNEFISGAYWEKCMIGGYGKSYSTGQATIMESVQLAIGRVIPAGNRVVGGKFSDFNLGEGNDSVASGQIPGASGVSGLFGFA